LLLSDGASRSPEEILRKKKMPRACYSDGCVRHVRHRMSFTKFTQPRPTSASRANHAPATVSIIPAEKPNLATNPKANAALPNVLEWVRMHETRNVWSTTTSWRSLMQRLSSPVIDRSTGTGHLISPKALYKPLQRCFERVRVAPCGTRQGWEDRFDGRELDSI
jgi:hypothetical protein